MKKLNLIMLVFIFQCCSNGRQNIDIKTFNDTWGVCFYISPRYVQDGCSYRAFFFPLQTAADTSLISKKSLPFDFKYSPGIRFYTYNSAFLRQIYFTNPLPGDIHEIQDNDHTIHWVFMKLKFKTNSGYQTLPFSSIRNDTVILHSNILKLKFYNFDQFIDVEKIKESTPDIRFSKDSIKLRVPKRKDLMPC